MQLVRNFATVGAMTAVSRVLGFVRDTFLAAALGAGPVADAFFVAFKLPNLFRRLFAEGAFNSAFVPLFTRVRAEEGAEGGEAFASAVFSWLVLILLTVTVLAEIFTPLLVLAMAPGFAGGASAEAVVIADLDGVGGPDIAVATPPDDGGTTTLRVYLNGAGALADRFGPRFFMGVGPLVSAAGLAWFLRIGADIDYVADVLPGLLVFSLGLAMTVAPLTAMPTNGSTVFTQHCVSPRTVQVIGIRSARARS